jgi:trimeric autotransporter adhesin
MPIIATSRDVGLLFAGVYDTFNRTTANGWGTSDSGAIWTPQTGMAAKFSTAPQALPTNTPVAVGAGTIVGDVGAPFIFAPAGLRDVEILFSINPPNGGANTQDSGVMCRVQGGAGSNNWYQVNAFSVGAGALSVQVKRNINGVKTNVVGADYATNISADGLPYWMRFRVYGANPTYLWWNMWKDRAAETYGWVGCGTDSLGPQVAGDVGCIAYASAGTVNTPFRSFQVAPITAVPQIPYKLGG